MGHISNVDSTLLITSEDKESEQISTFAIISKIWVWIATIFITFVVCLSVFPSVTAIVESTEKGKVSFVSVNPIRSELYQHQNIKHVFNCFNLMNRDTYGMTYILHLSGAFFYSTLVTTLAEFSHQYSNGPRQQNPDPCYCLHSRLCDLLSFPCSYSVMQAQ